MAEKGKAPFLRHRTELRVLYGDTDAGRVVYYANYLRFFEAGRTELIRDLGDSYRSLEERGFIMPVVESHARYKSPAFYDDLLVIETWITEVKKMSCRFEHRIFRKDEDQLLVRGYTVNAIIDSNGRLSRFPDPFYRLLLSATENPAE